jgi:O-acetyl-ADP-ribose deacetylase (regulator of RNase III)
VSGELKYVTGDVTDPQIDYDAYLIHVCNNANGFGSGVAGAIARRWPRVKREFHAWARDGIYATNGGAEETPYRLGEIQTISVQETPRLTVVNMVAQDGYWKPGESRGRCYLNYASLALCLNQVMNLARIFEMDVVAPRFGSALAGGNWNLIEEMIQRGLCDNGVNVTIYDPPTR